MTAARATLISLGTSLLLMACSGSDRTDPTKMDTDAATGTVPPNGTANGVTDTSTVRTHPVQHDGITHIESEGKDSIAPPEQ